MSRLTALDPATATGDAKGLLDAVQRALGITPNMTRIMANSPAVLEGYLSFSGALAKGSLGAKLREQIALATAEANACEYCLSAHSLIGKKVGLNDAEISAGRNGTGDDGRTRAALGFATALVRSGGQVDDASLTALKNAGFSDGQIGEIVANVALNIFTNYFNNVAATDIDFPRVKLSAVR